MGRLTFEIESLEIEKGNRKIITHLLYQLSYFPSEKAFPLLRDFERGRFSGVVSFSPGLRGPNIF